MNDTTQKIAEEAWKEITESGASSNPQTYIAIIQSAIEKATEELREENKGLRGEVDGWKWVKVEDEPRAAHASEPIVKRWEETHLAESKQAWSYASDPWTVERIEQIMRDDPTTWKSALAFELNATKPAHAGKQPPKYYVRAKSGRGQLTHVVLANPQPAHVRSSFSPNAQLQPRNEQTGKP